MSDSIWDKHPWDARMTIPNSAPGAVHVVPREFFDKIKNSGLLPNSIIELKFAYDPLIGDYRFISPSKSKAKLRVVDPGKKRATRVRKRMLSQAVDTVDAEPDMAGFAIVAWDSRGNCTTSVQTSDGPIGPGMLASFVRDALTRRVAEEDTVERINKPFDPSA